MPAREIAISRAISRERRAPRDEIAKRASFEAANERNGPKLASPERGARQGDRRAPPQDRAAPSLARRLLERPAARFFARFIQ